MLNCLIERGKGQFCLGYWRSSLADKFPPDSIYKSLFTHLFYHALVIDPITDTIIISPTDESWMKNFTPRGQNSTVKCFLSIEGDPNAFSIMVSTQDGRRTFIRSSNDMAKKYGFDGLKLYRKYPNTSQYLSNLSLLFKDWRDTFKLESSRYGNLLLYLSAIVYFEPIPPGNTTPYPVHDINEHVDFISPVCYNYYWGGETTVTYI